MEPDDSSCLVIDFTCVVANVNGLLEFDRIKYLI